MNHHKQIKEFAYTPGESVGQGKVYKKIIPPGKGRENKTHNPDDRPLEKGEREIFV